MCSDLPFLPKKYTRSIGRAACANIWRIATFGLYSTKTPRIYNGGTKNEYEPSTSTKANLMKVSDAKLQGLWAGPIRDIASQLPNVRSPFGRAALLGICGKVARFRLPLYTYGGIIMIKRILPLLLTALLLIAALPVAAFAEEAVPTKAQVIAGVSFRDAPSTSSNVFRYLKAGEVVTVVGQTNPYWFKIQDQQGVTGYVSSSKSYTKFISNAKIIYGVNFRTAPSSTADRIRMLSAGEDMLVLEKINDSWYKAQDSKGVIGYVSSSSKYISVNNSIYKMDLPLADRIESFISEGTKYMGTPYEYGSDRFNTSTFDCSDFVQQAFWDATRDVIPGDSRGQADYVKSLGTATTDWHNLKRGDLMFFMSYYGYKASDYAGINESSETVTHVAIYLGNGQMLHTYSPEAGGVRIDTIGGNTWEYRFLYGGSFMK